MKLKLDLELTAVVNVTVEAVAVENKTLTLKIGDVVRKTFVVEEGDLTAAKVLEGRNMSLAPDGTLNDIPVVSTSVNRTGSKSRDISNTLFR